MAPQIMTKLYSWAPDAAMSGSLDQAQKTAALPFVQPHMALMPDAHVGIGSTVGSVIPTEGAIIPAAVGVDIGCGMAAMETNLHANDLPDDLGPVVAAIQKAVPAGMGQGHDWRAAAADQWLTQYRPGTDLDNKQKETAALQLGTLGGGNHFVEVCLDENDRVWIVLHSGSRGIGNQLARKHIDEAKAVCKRSEIGLSDPDLAYFLEGTPEFQAYLRDLLWAQSYAAQNREIMIANVVDAVFKTIGNTDAMVMSTTNCHHNYTEKETHFGRDLWVTRKGAIRAGVGDIGIIPGSMGAASFIVEGLGNPDSFNSCSHGAGRRLSRKKAKAQLSVESLREAMDGKAWLEDRADSLVDEHPLAYKDIDEVMANQADLVKIVHRLHQVANYKGI